jgi:hypothetical protein
MLASRHFANIIGQPCSTSMSLDRILPFGQVRFLFGKFAM